MNDCYPCTSWSYIDYYLRPKPAFYTIRRTFAPISVGVSRTPRSRFIDDNKPYESTIPPKFEVFAHNITTEKKELTLVIKAFDLFTGKFIDYENSSRQVSLLPGQNTELGTLNNPSEVNADSLIILSTSLIDGNGAVLARFVDWPEPFRYLNWPTGTRVTTTAVAANDGWETVEIESNNPVKGVLLDVESGEMPEWEDNMVDLLPGDKVRVNVKGLGGRKITSRWLNDWEQQK